MCSGCLKAPFKTALAVVGFGRASDELRDERKRICDNCEDMRKVGAIEMCGFLFWGDVDEKTCGCELHAKRLVLGEQCPQEKWPGQSEYESMEA